MLGKICNSNNYPANYVGDENTTIIKIFMSFLVLAIKEYTLLSRSLLLLCK